MISYRYGCLGEPNGDNTDRHADMAEGTAMRPYLQEKGYRRLMTAERGRISLLLVRTFLSAS